MGMSNSKSVKEDAIINRIKIYTTQQFIIKIEGKKEGIRDNVFKGIRVINIILTGEKKFFDFQKIKLRHKGRDEIEHKKKKNSDDKPEIQPSFSA